MGVKNDFLGLLAPVLVPVHAWQVIFGQDLIVDLSWLCHSLARSDESYNGNVAGPSTAALFNYIVKGDAEEFADCIQLWALDKLQYCPSSITFVAGKHHCYIPFNIFPKKLLFT